MCIRLTALSRFLHDHFLKAELNCSPAIKNRELGALVVKVVLAFQAHLAMAETSRESRQGDWMR